MGDTVCRFSFGDLFMRESRWEMGNRTFEKATQEPGGDLGVNDIPRRTRLAKHSGQEVETQGDPDSNSDEKHFYHSPDLTGLVRQVRSALPQVRSNKATTCSEEWKRF